ncbi:RNA methyltransferase [Patescibacteria group bacterium]|nr:RNA methyltransferase [Patescibacteria group bacterium]
MQKKRKKKRSPKTLRKKSIDKIIVICHNIRSAFNVGSIFRTADGAGVSKIILGGYSASPPHPKLAKTALGAEKTMPYERVWLTWRVIEELKKQGYGIVALEKGRGAKNIFQFKPKFPLVLVLGNEVRGLSKEILQRCDRIVSIPMVGKKESLNVSVAFGVGIYQLRNTK